MRREESAVAGAKPGSKSSEEMESRTPSAVRLRQEVAFIAGLVSVNVEERVHPLWLRAGTEDVDRAIATLDVQQTGLKFPHEPRRILEIGAGSGYRTVALASDYPAAEILSLEADPALQRVGLLNTLSYDSITYRTVAVSTGETNYDYFGRTGSLGRLTLIQHETGSIKSTKLQHVLQFHRFNDADTLIITPDAASAPILASPLPSSIRVIAVETGGVPLEAETARCYPLKDFVTIISGNYVLLYRRGVPKLPAVPRRMAVFAPDGAPRSLHPENVPEGGFFALPGGGFRLHPNIAGGPPARIIISAEISDHGELQVSMRLVLDHSPPVRFTVKIFTEGGTMLASGIEVVQGGQRRIMVLALPEHHGRCEIVFSTELAGPGITNIGAWAEIISATLV